MQLDLVWIIYKSNSNSAKKQAFLCSEELNSQGISTKIISNSLNDNNFSNLLKSNQAIPNLAIVLGGDGTVLGAARNISIHGIPIISFNVGGNLGFLTHDRIVLERKDLWEKIKDNKFKIENRMMLEANIEIDSIKGISNKENTFFFALNDIYFRSYYQENSPTCSLELEINNEAVDIYKGDGLIVSTPTGSTAYAMAAGGSILHPSIEAFVVSAICPMSLSSRPIVVPANSRLIIKPQGSINKRVKVWQDGIDSRLLHTEEKCVIKKANHYAKILLLNNSPSYYRVLTQKLHWAGSFNNNLKS